jgi:type I restriction-modification system DNA methylase subunit
MLLECCALDWSRISPAIFGALFQSVMDQKQRRDLGAHYTTEKNILKLIGPLFLDELRAEFERVKNTPKKVYEFHQRLAKLKFFDPACGCGNFLVIAYRELRLIELEILRVLYGKSQMLSLDVGEFNILCDVDQFYGIEIEEFPAQIAQTALWLMDHQMNMLVSEEFGSYFVRLPLKKSATIKHGNALQIDWRDVVKPSELTYILGNPPFVGKKEQGKLQKQNMGLQNGVEVLSTFG